MDWLEEAIKRQATPKHARVDSVEEFCAKYNIDIKQYYYQLSKPDNKKKVLETVLSVAKDSSPEVLDVLVKKAQEGDMKAIDLYMDMILQLAKNLDVKTDGKPIIQIAEAIANKHGLTTSSTESNS